MVDFDNSLVTSGTSCSSSSFTQSYQLSGKRKFGGRERVGKEVKHDLNVLLSELPSHFVPLPIPPCVSRAAKRASYWFGSRLSFCYGGLRQQPCDIRYFMLEQFIHPKLPVERQKKIWRSRKGWEGGQTYIYIYVSAISAILA